MRGRKCNVALGIALGELLLVQPVDGAAGDELDRHAGLGREFLGDRFRDKIAPAAAPDADDEFVLRLGGHGDRKNDESEQKAFHVLIPVAIFAMAQSDFAALRLNILHHRCRIDNSTDLSYIRAVTSDRGLGKANWHSQKLNEATTSRLLAKELIDGGVG